MIEKLLEIFLFFIHVHYFCKSKFIENEEELITEVNI